MRNEIIKAVEAYKLIAILRGVPSEKLISVVEAMYQGGIRLLEITYSADGSTPDEVTAENIGRLASHFKGRMYIGAGTGLTPEQVRMTKAVGGQFIVSPDTSRDVITETVKKGHVSIPGALTPTEIRFAHDCGADFVKLFPVKTMGSEYVKQVRAPLSHIKLLAVGGINEKNIAEYLAAGVSGFGLGSNIAKKELVEAEDYAAITALAAVYVEAVNHG